jgi:hypothetical protein
MVNAYINGMWQMNLFSGQSTDTIFIDSTNHKTFYRPLGSGTWPYGNNLCQRLGGHLPFIDTPGKDDFLRSFGNNYLIGLSSNVRH